MVKTSKQTSLPWIKPALVNDGDLCTIVDRPFVQPAAENQFKKDRTIITVKLAKNGEVHRWGLNATSNDFLMEKYGEEMDNWFGKPVKIQKMPTVVRGESKEVLYAQLP